MKNTLSAIALLSFFIMAGCGTTGGTASVGALGGAAAGGGVYEYRLHKAKQRIESEHKAGKMDDKEYNARKDEIERLQLLK
ncbi:lipoprotein, putative [Geotalea daltonii FRC-32]|uniref:Lipoprotein, putative n=1 Tax=Geotalea daltonii (strain DSM 22248 / JCM 15807 / FRC-32) TaxID=316067 RepID=B9M9B2_GEODF|nr:hypothetical protein [Geotalea daltonii]ACM18670.1 lipoprotein, putative [Geotalea daltonii FRC-32]